MLLSGFQIPSGVPLREDYEKLQKTHLFRAQEVFSDTFLRQNADCLQPYAKAWTADPFHQWSRQWEYPFVGSRINSFNGDNRIRVLDAGSGVTFFPFFISKAAEIACVDCCDNDPRLEGIYKEIIARMGSGVRFTVADLRALPFEDDAFDVVYCISVLEHTDAYEAIINEFLRILRSGGKLVLSFDISIDGKDDISVPRASALIELLAYKFACPLEKLPDIRTEALQPAAFSTRSTESLGHAALPWRSPSPLNNMLTWIRTGRFITVPYLTFCCLDLTKP